MKLLAVFVALAVAGIVVAADRWASGAGGPAPAAAARGRTVYAEACASCHGARGEGAPNWRVADANGALPAPPHDASGHTWHHPDGLLFRIVRDGCAAYATGSTPPCNMPAFGELLADDDMRAVIEFLRSWWGPDERGFQDDVSKEDPFP